MKKKLDEFKIRTAFSSLLILLPIIIGIALWDRIPNSLLPNSSITTNIDTPIYKILLVFGIPILLLMVNLICLNLTYKDNRKINQSQKIMNSIFYICPAISIISNIFFYNGIIGNDFNLTRISPCILGVLFVLLGNNMPKVKPNSTYGVKIYWALKNNENWTKTHRFSGIVWVCAGITLLLLPALPLNYILPIMISVLLLCVILPIAYSFCYYKKQIKNGTYKEDGVLPEKYKKTQIIKVIIVIIITVSGLLAILLTGNIDARLESDRVRINASYYTDIEIPYDNIERIEYREHKNIGSRVAGFGSFKLSLGFFNNAEFGNYTCYVYNSTKACIAIKTNDSNVLINAENDEQTKELYDELIEKIE